MGFYNDLVLPRLLDHAMRNEELVGYRRRIVGAAQGRVLEVGIGSGLNLPLYGPGVTEIIGLDPSGPLIGMASRRAGVHDRAVSFLTASAEAIPLDTGSADAVVTTWTMCSIPDARAALAEMRRVLRPGGDLLFVEHGRAPDHWVVRFQDWLTPVCRPLAGAVISTGRWRISSWGPGSGCKSCGRATRPGRSPSPSSTKGARQAPERMLPGGQRKKRSKTRLVGGEAVPLMSATRSVERLKTRRNPRC
ncbi:Methyltransferase domain-containing protein [Microvirga guangxiensis]|uniref:Methyltransferase domain-containing protein n=1 Tax=Microvirga guangxiensis TaxID=549386 RepID=A0A1G5HMW1_9HYPH|nr:Methyltransferase domain-containing protein [Microvirga guangxiensis]